MKFINLTTLGVAIGCIHILGFCATLIYIIVVLCEFNNLSDEVKQANDEVVSMSITVLFTLLVICVIAIIFSGLLVIGIIKQRRNLMKPWIYCAIAGFVCHLCRLLIGTIGAFVIGLSFGEILLGLILNLLTLGILSLIFYPIYKIFKQIPEYSRHVLHEASDPEPASLSTDVEDKPPSYGELEKTGKISNNK
ncbi:uncharacterized protein ACRADG_010512 [Cochliomyia hominivorax]